MKISDALVKALIQLDVKYVFGVSGANIEHLHDAIHRLGGKKIQSVLAKCETNAGFMADCYARVHQTLGVCCATSGGGMTYLLSGIAESYSESVPVLAIVGQAPQELEGKGGFQDSSGLNRTVNAMQLFQSISKYVGKVTKAEEFWPIFTRAVKEAMTGRQGPAVILVPRNLYDQEVEDYPSQFWTQFRTSLRKNPIGQEQIAPIISALTTAKSPVLIVGQGVRRSCASEAVIQFAQMTGIPVATTMSARGEYPNDAANYLGFIGASGNPSAHRYVQDKADLVVAVGTRLAVMTRGPLATVLPKKRSIVIGEDILSPGKALSPIFSLQADPGMVFQAMVKEVEKKPLSFGTIGDYVRQVYEARKIPLPPFKKGENTLLQSQALGMIDRILPENGHLIFDAGNCAAAALHYTRVPKGSSSIIALGMGAMGYAIGGAIGAQIGSPKGTRTIAFVGDGAFLMAGLEIHTAVELGLPILYVIFNNSAHGMCVTRQQLFFGGRIEAATYGRVEIAQVVRGLGGKDKLWVAAAGTPDELAAALKDYEPHQHLPAVLELKIDQEEIPPFGPLLPKDAKIITSGDM